MSVSRLTAIITGVCTPPIVRSPHHRHLFVFKKFSKQQKKRKKQSLFGSCSHYGYYLTFVIKQLCLQLLNCAIHHHCLQLLNCAIYHHLSVLITQSPQRRKKDRRFKVLHSKGNLLLQIIVCLMVTLKLISHTSKKKKCFYLKVLHSLKTR